jgi:serine/threonine-protein kinase
VGRYLIIDRLGAGGMSVVYSAYDPDLDRKVAIKVMRVKYWDADGQQRMLREGQAMARLSHPNVVVVHDVGTLGDQLFIAMELVDGVTVKDWLGEGPRPWRAVLDVLVQVGRGLAAAHTVGIVHRDVKPANVLVDRDGRARVSDFGIAFSAAHATVSTSDGVAGTPAYMAPEQRQGKSDPRSDQYGFAVMAKEALEGAAGCPGWLRAAVQRGAAEDPAARYPSMDEMLAAMTADPSVRRRRVLAGVLVTALVAGAAAAAFWLRPAAPAVAPPCQGFEGLLAGVWDDAVAARVEDSFRATGLAHAADTFTRLDRLLDARARAWVTMRREACEATRVRGDQSERVLDLRTQCLDGRLAEMKALTGVLAGKADTELIDHALTAAAALPAIDRCADAAALEAAYPLPDGAEPRARALELRQRLAEVHALFNTGRYPAGLEAASAVAADAARLGWPPAEAEALFMLGVLQSYNGDAAASEATLERAMQRAADARDDELVAQAGLELVYVIGYELARPDDALRLAELVDLFVRRAGDDPELRARLLDRTGVVLWSKGAYAEAQDHFERELAILEDLPDADALIASAHTNLGNALGDAGKNQEALEHYQKELAIVERTVGPEHPSAARARANMGTVLDALGRVDEARASFERALAVWEAAYGGDHLMVAMASNNLGALYNKQGQPEKGLGYCQRALEIGERQLPADHPIHVHHLHCVTGALTGLGRHAEAVPLYERAITLGEAGGGGTGLAESRFGLARALWALDRERRRALELARKARAAYAAAGEGGAEALAEVDAWLAARGGAGK